MKIIFLGTNHGMEDTRSGRNRQSILIESGERAYLFDAGAPVLKELSKINYDLSRIKAIFISHSHDDHIHCLSELSETTELTARFYLPDDEQMAKFSKKYDRRYIKICEGNFYNDLFVKVSSVKTRHLIGPEDESLSHAFYIETEGKRICITGDMTPELTDFPAFLYDTHIDLLVSESAHFTVDELFAVLTKCHADRVAVIHVYPEDKYNELNTRVGKDNFELLLPDDGDEYII